MRSKVGIWIPSKKGPDLQQWIVRRGCVAGKNFSSRGNNYLLKYLNFRYRYRSSHQAIASAFFYFQNIFRETDRKITRTNQLVLAVLRTIFILQFFKTVFQKQLLLLKSDGLPGQGSPRENDFLLLKRAMDTGSGYVSSCEKDVTHIYCRETNNSRPLCTPARFLVVVILK